MTCSISIVSKYFKHRYGDAIYVPVNIVVEDTGISEEDILMSLYIHKNDDVNEVEIIDLVEYLCIEHSDYIKSIELPIYVPYNQIGIILGKAEIYLKDILKKHDANIVTNSEGNYLKESLIAIKEGKPFDAYKFTDVYWKPKPKVISPTEGIPIPKYGEYLADPELDDDIDMDTNKLIDEITSDTDKTLDTEPAYAPEPVVSNTTTITDIVIDVDVELFITLAKSNVDMVTIETVCNILRIHSFDVGDLIDNGLLIQDNKTECITYVSLREYISSLKIVLPYTDITESNTSDIEDSDNTETQDNAVIETNVDTSTNTVCDDPINFKQLEAVVKTGVARVTYEVTLIILAHSNEDTLHVLIEDNKLTKCKFIKNCVTLLSLIDYITNELKLTIPFDLPSREAMNPNGKQTTDGPKGKLKEGKTTTMNDNVANIRVDIDHDKLKHAVNVPIIRITIDKVAEILGVSIDDVQMLLNNNSIRYTIYRNKGIEFVSVLKYIQNVLKIELPWMKPNTLLFSSDGIEYIFNVQATPITGTTTTTDAISEALEYLDSPDMCSIVVQENIYKYRASIWADNIDDWKIIGVTDVYDTEDEAKKEAAGVITNYGRQLSSYKVEIYHVLKTVKPTIHFE